MKYLSLCSGIEAATVAWHPLGWEAVAYSEIERFPSEVLAHHYPNTPNLGDMTKFKEWTNVSDVDLLVGGTPCQSFSVAGLRKGLDDPRGNLMLTYLAIADKYRPKWLVWENVPGVLSSNGGHDFASFLRGLGELGYGFAYRVLDAQYFGVAQRRRRVFVVGYLGDWQRAAAVLFERDSLCGNPAPSREKRESVAGTIKASVGTGGVDVEHPMVAVQKWPADISSTLDTTFGAKMGLENQHVNAGCPMFVPAKPIALAENTIGRKPENGGNGDGFTDGGPMYTLNATGVHGVAQPISFDMAQITSKVNGTRVEPGLPVSTLAKGSQMHVAIAQPMVVHGTQDPCVSDIAFAQGRNNGGENVLMQPMAVGTDIYNGAITGDVAVPLTNRADGTGTGPTVMQSVGTDLYNGNITGDVAATMGTPGSSSNASGPTVMQSMAVRRLTPVECERLQGFPDTYTDIKSKGKATPDGPRYKALGNSMAVPVMAWIGNRIQQVENLKI